MAATAARIQLNLPRPVRVRVGAAGAPARVDGQAIELVRESWLVEDRWWTAQPLRRRYWEVVSSSGRNMVVFHDLGGDAQGVGGSNGAGPGAGRERPSGWFVQRS
jgi:hypothetical protein